MTVNVAQLKREHPIAEVVGRHGVALRRQGRRLVGHCPFHEDDHPSLVVYPDTDSFYCFGCQAGGDVISFVRRAEALGFLDAVAHLAGAPRAKRDHRPPRDEDSTAGERIVLTAACQVYHEALLRSEAALAYLAGRGVDRDVIRRCRLGYADGHSLRPYLERHRLGVRRAVDLGLLWARGGGEPLAGRVIVPELRGGECIWLLVRALDETTQPRYWSIARPKPVLGYERVQGSSHVVVTEGAFDYLTGVRWGLPICALLGTHAGAGRLGFLERAARVDLVFDTDPPGRQAAAELAARLGGRPRVIALPAGVKDLSELGSRSEGRAIFRRLQAAAGCHEVTQPACDEEACAGSCRRSAASDASVRGGRHVAASEA